MIALCDEHEVDFIILARYMRILPAASCWKYAGGRIINLHHGLLPSFPGMKPYHDAYASRMLTYGCTCHFIVPDLDAGNQIIYQSTFLVPPGAPLDEIIHRGQSDNEPHCLVEGVRAWWTAKCSCTLIGWWRGKARLRGVFGPSSAILRAG